MRFRGFVLHWTVMGALLLGSLMWPAVSTADTGPREMNLLVCPPVQH